MNLLLALIFPIFLSAAPNEAAKSDIKIYVFVAETCPICQYYTKKLAEIESKFNHEIIMVFPNKLSSDGSVKAYMDKYQIKFKYIIDKDHKWVNKFNAEITPEVFVYNEKQDSVYYQGRIDDNYARVGKRKLKIQSDDLVNALNSIKENKTIENPVTSSVGCYISKKR